MYAELLEFTLMLIKQKYDAAREDIFMSSCGYYDQDAVAYKTVAATARKLIDEVSQIVGTDQDNSFISDDGPYE